MKTLWFKSCYRAVILCGAKTDTIRPVGRRKYAVGETIGLSVGARTPFAVARITAVEPVILDQLEPSRRAEVVALYEKKIVPAFQRICFELVAPAALQTAAPHPAA